MMEHSIGGGVYEEGEIRAGEEKISRDMGRVGKGSLNMGNKESPC